MKEHTNRVAKSRGDTQKPDIRLSAWTIFHNKEGKLSRLLRGGLIDESRGEEHHAGK